MGTRDFLRVARQRIPRKMKPVIIKPSNHFDDREIKCFSLKRMSPALDPVGWRSTRYLVT
ncbi:hypothetical protein HanRHA438_Chr01g0014111 [Helianthus annuus]|uniref:Uncharacterized protein n=1 Tax=Helianthus annuus TaxID=4232 RepID=A0A9K3P1N4_HELAN|nr:hypothetical protein HanXRQr2_Chr01g0013661 [Helianthus annuus]KAJ0947335.1 hypothetical protein HanRHA438_Chr01g0014111 [Helianthus annuus]KAJ0956302.1 hypothetical protein HanPSC8_Chr01g0013211 [Helianthus annuus]